MYKKTAKSQHRNMLKSYNYMPSLNTLSDKGPGIWKSKKKKTKSKAKKDDGFNTQRDTLFGIRFR